MSITGPGSITAANLLAQNNMSNQLNTLSQELGTGQAATTYSGLQSQAGLALQLSAQLADIGGYSSTTTTVGNTLTLAQSVLTQLGSSSSAVQQSLLQSSAFSLDNTGQTTAQVSAAGQLDQILAALNTQAGDNYMFSGSALNQPSVASASDILNGSGAQAGLTQVMAERLQADLGNGLGRLVIPASAGAVLSIGEDVAGSPFGFKLASVNSSLTGANVTGPSAPPATYSINLGPTNPNPGDSIQFNLTLPDGSSQSIALQAVANGTAQVNSSYSVAAAVGGTGANLIVPSTQSTVEVDATALGQLQQGDTLTFKLGSGATVTATYDTNNANYSLANNVFHTPAQLISILNGGGLGNLNGQAVAAADGAGTGVEITSNDVTNDFAIGGTGISSGHILAPATDAYATAHTLGSALTLTDGDGHSSSFYYVAGNASAANNTFTTAADLTAAINTSNVGTGSTGDITANNPAGGGLDLSSAPNKSITVGGAIGSALGFSTTPYKGSSNTQPGANQFMIGANTTATAANLQAALTAAVTNLAQAALPAASAMAAANNFFDGETQLTSPNTVAAALGTAGITASTQSTNDITAAALNQLTTLAPADYGDTFVFQLGNDPPVTATFGSALNLGTNTFNSAADLINVLNNGGSGNFAGQAVATTDGTGGVLLTSNDVVNNFAAAGGTAITSGDVSGANVTNTNLSLGSALTVSDGSHNSTLYWVANNASAANGTFNTAANLVSALNDAATPTRIQINGAAAGAGSAYLSLSNFNGPITVGGAIGAALGFPSGAVDNNVNTPLRVAGPPFNTATALVAGTAANTVFWYTGENGATPALQTATAQVGPSLTVSYGMRANEQAITTLVANVAVLAASTYSATDPNAQSNYQALTQDVTANLNGQPGTQQISDIEAEIASAQTTIQNATTQNTQTQTTLQDLLQGFEGVNQNQIGEDILTLQNNLSASMSVTARLAQLSLVNYLAPSAG